MTKLIKDGEVITNQQFVALYPNITFPLQIPYADYGWNVVFPKPQPSYNELTHKVIPAVPALNQLGEYEETWEVVALTQNESTAKTQENLTAFNKRKSDLITKIDADIDSIVTKVVGRRETEYLKAEEQALAYIAANYTGAVPAFVQSWATAKNQTATWSADDIAATAAAWRTAQASMRANRLKHKEDARNAADAAALSLIETSWNTFLAAIKTQLVIS